MKSSLWIKLAIIFQFITAALHSLSFIVEQVPENGQEKQLFDLMTQYKFDMGAGFYRSMLQLMASFSIGFTLFLVFSASINLFLLISKPGEKVLKGMLLINIVAYLICFISMLLLAFLPPIICTGLILLTLCIAWFRIKAEPFRQPETSITKGI